MQGGRAVTPIGACGGLVLGTAVWGREDMDFELICCDGRVGWGLLEGVGGSPDVGTGPDIEASPACWLWGRERLGEGPFGCTRLAILEWPYLRALERRPIVDFCFLRIGSWW